MSLPKVLGSAALAVVAVMAFVALVAMHAVHARVATESYFAGVLESSDLYHRLYVELLADPEFAPQVDELLGGVDVKRQNVVDAIRELVPPADLEATANKLIAHVVVHFASDAKLDLSFDITDIVKRVHAFALTAVARGLAALPVKRAESYEAFTAELAKVIGLMQGEGVLPEALPSFAIPPDQRAEIVDALVHAGGLDPADPAQATTIATIEEAIARDDAPAAIRTAAGSLLERLIAASIELLTHNAYVVSVAAADGPHFLLGPGDVASAKIERKLAQVRRVNRAADVGQIVAAIVLACALGALVLVQRRRARLWIGGSLLAAGSVTFVGWAIARRIIGGDLVELTSSKSLPASFRAIIADVLGKSVADFTPGFWIPAAVAAALGGVVVVVALASRR